MIARRELLAAGTAGAALFAAAPAHACSVAATRREPFSDRECLQSLRQWVNLLNAAPSMAENQLRGQVDDLSVSVNDDHLLFGVLAERVRDPDLRSYGFYREFRLSGGRLDPRPIRLAETNRIRRVGTRATYQFTLERYRYRPDVTEEEAAGDSCGNGAVPAHYETERTSYLATFWNNRLQAVKQFPEWYLEGAS